MYTDNKLFIDKDILVSYRDLRPVKTKKKKPNGPKIIRKVIPEQKPRRTDEYYFNLAVQKYEKCYLNVLKRLPFKDTYHKMLSFKSAKSKQNVMKIVNYLLEFRESEYAWNSMNQLLDDYFTCVLKNFNKYNGRLPTLHNLTPGPKNQDEFWRWIGQEELFLNSKYLSSKQEVLNSEKSKKEWMKKKPDDPWLDRNALLCGLEPTQRPNRYLMLNEDNSFVVLAEPIGAATVELIAYEDGNWLYRVIVDQSGNVLEIKETERT